MWINLNRYFPGLHSRVGFSSDNIIINREENIMMMAEGVHGQFGKFHFIFEAMQTPNRYFHKVFPKFARRYLRDLPSDRFVTFTSHDGRYPLPHPTLLAVHAAIGNILHLSAGGKTIEALKRDLGDMSGGLAREGSTRIENLLSVSKLSILSSGANRWVDHEENRRRNPG